MQELYEQNADVLYQYFVIGAPVVITDNINAEKNVVNGTRGTARSLIFAAEDADDNFAEQVLQSAAAAPAGSLITLPHAPAAVAVQLQPPSHLEQTWPANETLVAGQVVIPVCYSQRLASVRRASHASCALGVFCSTVVRTAAGVASYCWCRCDVCQVRVFLHGVPLRVMAKYHAVELAFSLTYHKVQGRTEPRLVVDLNKRPFKATLTLASIYVALSRVREGAHLRMLPAQPGTGFQHLLHLQHPKALVAWRAAYDANGVWQPALARTAMSTVGHH